MMKHFQDAALSVVMAVLTVPLSRINLIVGIIAGLLAAFYTSLKIWDFFDKRRKK